MKELKELLRIDPMASKEAIAERFEELAKMLFNEYEIIKRGIHYEFLEIEFYFFNSNHKDDMTYERTIKEGRWFFHPSGVDISFDSDVSKGYYGGILVRSIKKEDGTIINGPLKVVYEIFDHIDMDGCDAAAISKRKSHEFRDIKLAKTYRFNVASNAEYSYYDKDCLSNIAKRKTPPSIPNDSDLISMKKGKSQKH